MAAKLKVYRTAVGFRDAYVAAPSQAAALRAWGTDKNLFARGSAEVVADPDTVPEALSNPGEVVYRTRGGLKEQVAALDALPKRKARKQEPDDPKEGGKKPLRKKPAQPRPSRSELEAAEAAVRTMGQKREDAEAQMRKREKELAAERAAMKQRFDAELRSLQQKEQQARTAFEKALRAWEP